MSPCGSGGSQGWLHPSPHNVAVAPSGENGPPSTGADASGVSFVAGAGLPHEHPSFVAATATIELSAKSAPRRLFRLRTTSAASPAMPIAIAGQLLPERGAVAHPPEQPPDAGRVGSGLPRMRRVLTLPPVPSSSRTSTSTSANDGFVATDASGCQSVQSPTVPLESVPRTRATSAAVGLT